MSLTSLLDSISRQALIAVGPDATVELVDDDHFRIDHWSFQAGWALFTLEDWMAYIALELENTERILIASVQIQTQLMIH